ncbi:hypothetical protein ACOJUR_11010 [Alicyclobacillus tolerans]|uniref:Uncharacterized protein n=2 Tax=Alicyclobacillus tolerans TaxID=90970 RepID=A0ABT9LT59_9BACL|nr:MULTISPECIES: hypothetical protein [Alicyclobacillus]MDP9727450.1 hypothetical protein [Alicyclobacillus tengchongensis]SHJ48148.1 hypothetical protein SAMN05443507_1012 [Alicyclobacillus montanus]
MPKDKNSYENENKPPRKIEDGDAYKPVVIGAIIFVVLFAIALVIISVMNK